MAETQFTLVGVDIKRLRSSAIIPSYQSTGAAAIDLHSCSAMTEVMPGESVDIPTGIAIHIENPYMCGMIVPRSGLGRKGLILGNSVGIIDSDYQGEIIMIAYNRSNKPITITTGDRIAQMIFVSIERPMLREVLHFQYDTERSGKGFGSTGK